ncbi:protein translocase subunit SecF [Gayadomonas joobiniege]|uniref:protein translocase subunit SecF n=1 Tax=Gayadomonas joobiniege TaxID=1234606 RepID=UPI000370E53F|nr:protein translocase subunit SecF [Gayadomonas joobiniege]
MANGWKKVRTTGLVISIIAVLFSCFLIAQRGLQLGQDFTGGYVTEFVIVQDLDKSALQAQINPHLNGEFKLSNQGALQWQLFQPPQDNIEQPLAWQSQLPDELGLQILDSRYVGAQVGAELIEQGGLALFVSLILVASYLIIRFEWRLAVASSVALLHDVILTLACFSVTGMEFDLTVLAALLAIIGYSLNDSIIIGDKVRELIRTHADQPVANTINQALASTLGRTLITSSTTLTTIGAIWLLGGASLHGFASALFIGIVFGTWSSIFVSATLPQWLGLSYQNYQQKLSDEALKQLAEP